MFCLLLVGCQEEALVHPPPPPPFVAARPLALGPASVPAASHPADPSPTTAEAARAAASASVPALTEMPPLAGPRRVTLAEFMVEEIVPRAAAAMKKHRPDPKLESLLGELKTMLPADAKFAITSPNKSWAGIVDNSIKSGHYANSCKQCHALWLKPYKKRYHSAIIEYYPP